MLRVPLVILGVLAAACGGDDGRPVNIPAVAAGAFETDCQRLCTLASGDDHCTAKHAEFCLASCRARTNGLPAACGNCLVAAGAVIHGDVDGFGDPFCAVGGPADLTACATECDDAGAAPSTGLGVQCQLACTFYMQDTTALACSEDGSAECLAGCNAAVAANGRVCAQCLIEGTIPSRICINDDCDCQPYFDSDPGFACESLCDANPPV